MAWLYRFVVIWTSAFTKIMTSTNRHLLVKRETKKLYLCGIQWRNIEWVIYTRGEILNFKFFEFWKDLLKAIRKLFSQNFEENFECDIPPTILLATILPFIPYGTPHTAQRHCSPPQPTVHSLPHTQCRCHSHSQTSVGPLLWWHLCTVHCSDLRCVTLINHLRPLHICRTSWQSTQQQLCE